MMDAEKSTESSNSNSPTPPVAMLTVADSNKARLLCERIIEASLSDPRRLAAGLLDELPGTPTSPGELAAAGASQTSASPAVPNPHALLQRLGLPENPFAILGAGNGEAVPSACLVAKLACVALFEGPEEAEASPEFWVGSRKPESEDEAEIGSRPDTQDTRREQRREYLLRFLWEALAQEAPVVSGTTGSSSSSTRASAEVRASSTGRRSSRRSGIGRGLLESASSPAVASSMDEDGPATATSDVDGGATSEALHESSSGNADSMVLPSDAYPPALQRQFTDGLTGGAVSVLSPGGSSGALWASGSSSSSSGNEVGGRPSPRAPSLRFLQFVLQDLKAVGLDLSDDDSLMRCSSALAPGARVVASPTCPPERLPPTPVSSVPAASAEAETSGSDPAPSTSSSTTRQRFYRRRRGGAAAEAEEEQSAVAAAKEAVSSACQAAGIAVGTVLEVSPMPASSDERTDGPTLNVMVAWDNNGGAGGFRAATTMHHTPQDLWPFLPHRALANHPPQLPSYAGEEVPTPTSAEAAAGAEGASMQDDDTEVSAGAGASNSAASAAAEDEESATTTSTLVDAAGDRAPLERRTTRQGKREATLALEVADSSNSSGGGGGSSDKRRRGRRPGRGSSPSGPSSGDGSPPPPSPLPMLATSSPSTRGATSAATSSSDSSTAAEAARARAEAALAAMMVAPYSAGATTSGSVGNGLVVSESSSSSANTSSSSSSSSSGQALLQPWLNGVTPLQFAVLAAALRRSSSPPSSSRAVPNGARRVACVALLVKLGADADVPGPLGSARDLAVEFGDQEVGAALPPLVPAESRAEGMDSDEAGGAPGANATAAAAAPLTLEDLIPRAQRELLARRTAETLLVALPKVLLALTGFGDGSDVVVHIGSGHGKPPLLPRMEVPVGGGGAGNVLGNLGTAASNKAGGAGTLSSAARRISDDAFRAIAELLQYVVKTGPRDALLACCAAPSVNSSAMGEFQDDGAAAHSGLASVLPLIGQLTEACCAPSATLLSHAAAQQANAATATGQSSSSGSSSSSSSSTSGSSLTLAAAAAQARERAAFALDLAAAFGRRTNGDAWRVLAQSFGVHRLAWLRLKPLARAAIDAALLRGAAGDFHRLVGGSYEGQMDGEENDSAVVPALEAAAEGAKGIGSLQRAAEQCARQGFGPGSAAIPRRGAPSAYAVPPPSPEQSALDHAAAGVISSHLAWVLGKAQPWEEDDDEEDSSNMGKSSSAHMDEDEQEAKQENAPTGTSVGSSEVANRAEVLTLALEAAEKVPSGGVNSALHDAVCLLGDSLSMPEGMGGLTAHELRAHPRLAARLAAFFAGDPSRLEALLAWAPETSTQPSLDLAASKDNNTADVGAATPGTPMSVAAVKALADAAAATEEQGITAQASAALAGARCVVKLVGLCQRAMATHSAGPPRYTHAKRRLRDLTAPLCLTLVPAPSPSSSSSSSSPSPDAAAATSVRTATNAAEASEEAARALLGSGGGGEEALCNGHTLRATPSAPVSDLANHLLLAAPIADKRWRRWCTRLVGCVIEVRHLLGAVPPTAAVSSSSSSSSDGPPPSSSWRVARVLSYDKALDCHELEWIPTGSGAASAPSSAAAASASSSAPGPRREAMLPSFGSDDDEEHCRADDEARFLGGDLGGLGGLSSSSSSSSSSSPLRASTAAAATAAASSSAPSSTKESLRLAFREHRIVEPAPRGLAAAARAQRKDEKRRAKEVAAAAASASAATGGLVPQLPGPQAAGSGGNRGLAGGNDRDEDDDGSDLSARRTWRVSLPLAPLFASNVGSSVATSATGLTLQDQLVPVLRKSMLRALATTTIVLHDAMRHTTRGGSANAAICAANVAVRAHLEQAAAREEDEAPRLSSGGAASSSGRSSTSSGKALAQVLFGSSGGRPAGSGGRTASGPSGVGSSGGGDGVERYLFALGGWPNGGWDQHAASALAAARGALAANSVDNASAASATAGAAADESSTLVLVRGVTKREAEVIEVAVAAALAELQRGASSSASPSVVQPLRQQDDASVAPPTNAPQNEAMGDDGDGNSNSSSSASVEGTPEGDGSAGTLRSNTWPRAPGSRVWVAASPRGAVGDLAGTLARGWVDATTNTSTATTSMRSSGSSGSSSSSSAPRSTDPAPRPRAPTLLWSQAVVVEPRVPDLTVHARVREASISSISTSEAARAARSGAGSNSTSAAGGINANDDDDEAGSLGAAALAQTLSPAETEAAAAASAAAAAVTGASGGRVGTIERLEGGQAWVVWDPPRTSSRSTSSSRSRRNAHSTQRPSVSGPAGAASSSPSSSSTAVGPYPLAALDPVVATHMRVKRGPNWKYDNGQDGTVSAPGTTTTSRPSAGLSRPLGGSSGSSRSGRSGSSGGSAESSSSNGNNDSNSVLALGTVLGFSRRGVVRVRWDRGKPAENTYRADAKFSEVEPASAHDNAQFVCVVSELGGAGEHFYPLPPLTPQEDSNESSSSNGSNGSSVYNSYMASGSSGGSNLNLPLAVAAHPVPSDAPTLDALAVAVEDEAPGTDGGMGTLLSSGAGSSLSSEPSVLPPIPSLAIGARVALALTAEERAAAAAAATVAGTTASGAAGSPPRRSSGAGASSDNGTVALGVVVGVTPPDEMGGDSSGAARKPRSLTAKMSAAAQRDDQNTYAVALADGSVRKGIPRKRLQGEFDDSTAPVGAAAGGGAANSSSSGGASSSGLPSGLLSGIFSASGEGSAGAASAALAHLRAATGRDFSGGESGLLAEWASAGLDLEDLIRERALGGASGGSGVSSRLADALLGRSMAMGGSGSGSGAGGSRLSAGKPGLVPALKRSFSGVSLAMRSDGSDFLTGQGDTFEVSEVGTITQRETGEGLSLRRVRSMGRPLDDRPPRLRVLLRLAHPSPASVPVAFELASDSPFEEDAAVASAASAAEGTSREGSTGMDLHNETFNRTELEGESEGSGGASGASLGLGGAQMKQQRQLLHPHPVARVDEQFATNWPRAKFGGLAGGWRCDGFLPRPGQEDAGKDASATGRGAIGGEVRACPGGGSGADPASALYGRYRCTMGDDFDLCHLCWAARWCRAVAWHKTKEDDSCTSVDSVLNVHRSERNRDGKWVPHPDYPEPRRRVARSRAEDKSSSKPMNFNSAGLGANSLGEAGMEIGGSDSSDSDKSDSSSDEDDDDAVETSTGKGAGEEEALSPEWVELDGSMTLWQGLQELLERRLAAEEHPHRQAIHEAQASLLETFTTHDSRSQAQASPPLLGSQTESGSSEPKSVTSSTRASSALRDWAPVKSALPWRARYTLEFKVVAVPHDEEPSSLGQPASSVHAVNASASPSPAVALGAATAVAPSAMPSALRQTTNSSTRSQTRAGSRSAAAVPLAVTFGSGEGDLWSAAANGLGGLPSTRQRQSTSMSGSARHAALPSGFSLPAGSFSSGSAFSNGSTFSNDGAEQDMHASSTLAPPPSPGFGLGNRAGNSSTSSTGGSITALPSANKCAYDAEAAADAHAAAGFGLWPEAEARVRGALTQWVSAADADVLQLLRALRQGAVPAVSQRLSRLANRQVPSEAFLEPIVVAAATKHSGDVGLSGMSVSSSSVVTSSSLSAVTEPSTTTAVAVATAGTTTTNISSAESIAPAWVEALLPEERSELLNRLAKEARKRSRSDTSNSSGDVASSRGKRPRAGSSHSANSSDSGFAQQPAAVLTAQGVRRAVRKCAFSGSSSGGRTLQLPAEDDVVALEQTIAWFYEQRAAQRKRSHGGSSSGESPEALAASVRAARAGGGVSLAPPSSNTSVLSSSSSSRLLVAVARSPDASAGGAAGLLVGNAGRDAWARAEAAAGRAASAARALLRVWSTAPAALADNASSSSSSSSGSAWINPVWDQALSGQLANVFALTSQALPGWALLVPAAVPFLFNGASRRNLLQGSGFGVSRAVEHVQQADPASTTRSLEQSLNALNERVVSAYMTGKDPQRLQVQADGIEDRIRDRRLRYHLGVPRHDYVRGVRRAQVLEDAKYLAKVLARSRAALQVTFAQESGHGDGVTRGFYVAVAEASQSRRLNVGMLKLPPHALQLVRGSATATATISSSGSAGGAGAGAGATATPGARCRSTETLPPGAADALRSLRQGDSLFVVLPPGTPAATADALDDDAANLPDANATAMGRADSDERKMDDDKEAPRTSLLDLDNNLNLFGSTAAGEDNPRGDDNSDNVGDDDDVPPGSKGVETVLRYEIVALQRNGGALKLTLSRPFEGPSTMTAVGDAPAAEVWAARLGSPLAPGAAARVVAGPRLALPDSSSTNTKSRTTTMSSSHERSGAAVVDKPKLRAGDVIVVRALASTTHGQQDMISVGGEVAPSSSNRATRSTRSSSGGVDAMRTGENGFSSEEDDEGEEGGSGIALGSLEYAGGKASSSPTVSPTTRTAGPSVAQDPNAPALPPVSRSGGPAPPPPSDEELPLSTQLRQLEARLRQTRDRKEIPTLMRRRGELQRKVMAEQALLLAAAALNSNAARPCRDLDPGSGGSPRAGPGGDLAVEGKVAATAAVEEDPEAQPSVDERGHWYRVVHVGRGGHVTLDRPCHVKAPGVKVALEWPTGGPCLFVPDGGATEAYSSGGCLANAQGLFPAPLPPCAPALPVLEHFYFLGLLTAKALQDGALVPLPLHPLFFTLVTHDRPATTAAAAAGGGPSSGYYAGSVAARLGLAVDPTPALSGSTSHMVGCAGETVAKMMALLPALRRAEAANHEAARLAALVKEVSTKQQEEQQQDGDAGNIDANAMKAELEALEAAAATAAKAATVADKLVFDAPHPFTAQGQTLREMLRITPLEFADPITGLALAPLPEPTHPSATSAQGPSDAANAGTPSGTPPPPLPLSTAPIAHPSVVTPGTLRQYLESVAEFWLGHGVARQVAAFRRGVSAVFGWRRLLAFSPQELADMVCGAGSVEWTEKSLKALLRPAGGFDERSPTMAWLRQELLRFTPPERRSFLKFSTAVPRLVPGLSLTVACKGTGGGWLPTAQTCTPQLNLAVYSSRQDLASALREAMANADADGGFHERAAGSDGNTDDTNSSSGGGGGGFGSGLGDVYGGFGMPREVGSSAHLPPSMRSGSSRFMGDEDDESEIEEDDAEGKGEEDDDSEFDGPPFGGGDEDDEDEDDAEGEHDDEDSDDDGDDGGHGMMMPPYAAEGMMDSDEDEDADRYFEEGEDDGEIHAGAEGEASFYTSSTHSGWRHAEEDYGDEDDEDDEEMNDFSL